jgi:hypothetical protein
MSYYCPTCQRIIFNRRLARCEFCNAGIPAELRFSANEIAKLDRQMSELAARRKKRDIEQEEDRKKAEGPSRGFIPGPRAISEIVAKWNFDDPD